MPKMAILQVADQGPAESLIVMLRSIGYQCYFPSDGLINELRHIGCDTVISIKQLVDSWGYENPVRLPECGVSDLVANGSQFVFVCVKGHRNYSMIINRFPHLKKRVLWYRINGGKPEHVIRADGFDCGNENNPPCPVLTPNQWYSTITDKAYTCWPPFYRFDEYYNKHGRTITSSPSPKDRVLVGWERPVCLIHNLNGWGYGLLAKYLRNTGVLCFGVNSPDGLINHGAIPNLLSRTLCMIHLKSSDAPGYALYEAMAAGCPIICSRRLIWRCKMQELLIPNETCLVFDRETHDELSENDARICRNEIMQHIESLSDANENIRIGTNARKKLAKLMWNETNTVHVNSFRKFMDKHFGE